MLFSFIFPFFLFCFDPNIHLYKTNKKIFQIYPFNKRTIVFLSFQKHKSYINKKMPYILFTTHHRQRATNQETRCTTLLHSGSSSTCNHSSVTGGQHASWLIHVDHNEAEKSLHFVLLLQCSVTKKCYSVSCIHTLSLPPDHNLQTLCFIKMEIDHLLTMFDFKASQCTFFCRICFLKKNPQ